MTNNTQSIPSWAKAVIIAELMQDESDLQTDYFGGRAVRKIVLGFSKHTRNLFPEMRKMAERYEPTRHLGRNKGVWEIWDHWQDESGRENSIAFHGDDHIRYFSTEEEAIAYADRHRKHDEDNSAALKRGDIDAFCCKVRGELKITGGTKNIEHRENYSMGGGYYLGWRRYSGWKICKEEICEANRDEILTLIQAGHHALKTPQPQSKKSVKAKTANPESVAGNGVTVTENADKDGVEIRFAEKPDEAVRASLKAQGFRWSRFSNCWYAKRFPSTLEFAYSFVEQEPVSQLLLNASSQC